MESAFLLPEYQIKSLILDILWFEQLLERTPLTSILDSADAKMNIFFLVTLI